MNRLRLDSEEGEALDDLDPQDEVEEEDEDEDLDEEEEEESAESELEDVAAGDEDDGA